MDDITVPDLGPRVTSEDIDREIRAVHYFRGDDGVYGARIAGSDTHPYDPPVHEPLSLITFCVIELHNGYTVTGQSACASAANFDAAVGQHFALADAKKKIWPLLGFRLRDRMTAAEYIGFDPRARPLGDPYDRGLPIDVEQFELV